MKLPAYELAQYFVDQGIARDSSEAGTLPTVWVEMDAPAPDDAGGTPTITITMSGGPATSPMREWWRRLTVDVTIRAEDGLTAAQIGRQIELSFRDADRPAMWRQALDLGSLQVEQVLLWRPLQRIYLGETEAAQGSVYVMSLLLCIDDLQMD